MTIKHLLVLLTLSFLCAPAAADDASIKAVEVRYDGTAWAFFVTLEHGDIGWYDYADGWRVVAEDGTEFGMRALLHPHVDEQPFTRSLANIVIPHGTARVFVEARTITDGWGSVRFAVDLLE